MPHNISALLVKGDVRKKAVTDWDLIIEELPFDIKLAYIDHNYTAYWQKIKRLDGYLPTSGVKLPTWVPTQIVLLEIAKDLKGEENPIFAFIHTDYIGGIGEQFARVYCGENILDPKIDSISQALKKLGVKASGKMDEFDTIGLSKFRSNPDYLEKYMDMADELGV